MSDHPARSPLDTARLRSALDGIWGRIDVVEETGSTNADLLALAAAGEPVAGRVLLAEYQSEGRGRHGRHWQAPPRSQVAVSVGVDAAAIPPAGWGWLPLVTGVAVADALAATGVDTQLKWPNDVLAGGSAGQPAGKLAGILAEVAAPTRLIVVGLGINVTMTADEAPDPAATSLAMLGKTVDRTELAVAVLRSLAARIGAWQAADGNDRDVEAEYRRRSATIGSRVRADLPDDSAVEGLAAAVDDTGRLCVDTGAETVTLSAGDITHLRTDG